MNSNVRDPKVNDSEWRAIDWRVWLQVCCDRLRYHPIFTNPQTEEAKAACEVCRKYVWSKEEVKSGNL